MRTDTLCRFAEVLERVSDKFGHIVGQKAPPATAGPFCFGGPVLAGAQRDALTGLRLTLGQAIDFTLLARTAVSLQNAQTNPIAEKKQQ